LSTDADGLAIGLSTGMTLTDAVSTGNPIISHLSSDLEHISTSAAILNSQTTTHSAVTGVGDEKDWDDEALAASLQRNHKASAIALSSSSTGTTTELLDMKALDAKRRTDDDIAERLRIEETKAQLAAAKEGMEREAQRVKAEQAERSSNNNSNTSNQTNSTTGNKWIAPHLRSSGGRALPNSSSSLSSSKFDVQDENLFPDLAAADAILEQKKDQVAYRIPKKTPVGGGATWASASTQQQTAKETVALPKESQIPVATTTAKVSKQTANPEQQSNQKIATAVDAMTLPSTQASSSSTTTAKPEDIPETAVASNISASATPAPVKKVVKKKKKDMSTFKVASS
jgi:hypothetical protein